VPEKVQIRVIVENHETTFRESPGFFQGKC